MEPNFEILEHKLDTQKNKIFSNQNPSKKIDLTSFQTFETSLQSLQLNLQRLTNYRKKVTLQFFSSIRQEGTSTIASHYALLVAQNNLSRRNGTIYSRAEEREFIENTRILLIDANLRHPKLHQIFDIPNEIGFSNLILDESNVSEAIVSISDTRLDVLPSGSHIDNPTRLLESEALQTLMQRLQSIYSLIIIDSTPIVTYSDAFSFADYIDGAVLVIQASQTRREIIESAKKKLAHVGINILGVVLNKRQYHIPKFIYQYL